MIDSVMARYPVTQCNSANLVLILYQVITGPVLPIPILLLTYKGSLWSGWQCVMIYEMNINQLANSTHSNDHKITPIFTL